MATPTEPETTLEQVLQAATEHHLAGRLQEAGAGYARVLAVRPDHGTALHRMGVLALQVGQADGALDLLGRAVALDPAAWRSHCSMGQALQALGRTLEALEAFRRASALNPACLEAWQGAGEACRSLGRRQEALAAFVQAAVLRPDQAETLNDLGIALQDGGLLADAIAAYRRALELRDDFPIAHSNLGNALLADRQVDQALAVLRGAVAHWPDYADAWYNLGNAAFTALHFPEAAEAYQRALAHAPGHASARNNLGNTLQALGRNEEALAAYLEALRANPGFVDAYNNASGAARALGRLDDALELLRRAAEVRPDSAVVHGNLGTVLKDLGLMDEAVRSFRAALALDPADHVTHSNLAYSVSFLPGCTAAEILRENREWDRAHALPGARRDHGNDPDPERRLRIGYVSPDFRDHCQSFFTIPLLANHDRARFEIFCYASVARPDAVTRRIAGYADTWRETAALGDPEVAALVLDDRIDILVDLTMHMSSGRPRLFTLKPAPVQAAWLAYPGTTGLAAMDYRLTDPYLDPPGAHDDWYSEISLRLPDTFWCYDPLTAEPAPGPLPALAGGGVTFGSLNNFCKVTPAVLDLWARVLTTVPGSRLILLAPPVSRRQWVLDRLLAGGVEPERVEFSPFLPRAEYLALHRRLDLGLDTFPYNGHTTSLDAFWMGVPVVTQLGDTVVGRAGWSQLCNLGLRDLAATGDDEFVRIAAELAADLPRLAEIRAGLRARMEASPLMDGLRFAGNLETAYRQMWRRWCLDR
jgi:predicted O-linked N-acetylglucosamine transferase (SPINDLY family)